MEELLRNKLEAALELRNFTNEIMKLSLKIEYNTANLMIGNRQRHIERINKINEEINKSEELTGSFEETDVSKGLKKEIREVFNEIYKMDNIIRKNISSEMESIKGNLDIMQDPARLVNIKA